jgi:integrase
VLKALEVSGAHGTYCPFDALISEVTEGDVKAWLIDWKRAPKTKANYHGLLYGVFNYALERGEIDKNPLLRTAPKRSKIRQSQADLRFLTEREFAITAAAAADNADLLRVTAGTGLRFGEVTALWVSDVDLRHQTIRVNKAWKRDGDDEEQDVPSWLARRLRAKHSMRGHHLGNPKTPKSRRTIEISDDVTAILARLVAGKAADDFVFVSPTGLPLHNALASAWRIRFASNRPIRAKLLRRPEWWPLSVPNSSRQRPHHVPSSSRATAAAT